MGRSPCCSKEGLNRGAWTAQEDKILRDYVNVHGQGKWRNLPQKAGLKRCGKSCRLRWLNYLRPDIKRGNISPDEEELIIRLHKLLGNKWSLIAGRLPGRTDNEIKNYWNTNLGKKVNKDGGNNSDDTLSGQGRQPINETKPPQSTCSNNNIMSKQQDSHVIRTKASKCSKLLFLDNNPIPPLHSSTTTQLHNNYVVAEQLEAEQLPKLHCTGQLSSNNNNNLITTNEMECEFEGVNVSFPIDEKSTDLLLDFEIGEICLPELLNDFTEVCGFSYNNNEEDLLLPSLSDQPMWVSSSPVGDEIIVEYTTKMSCSSDEITNVANDNLYQEHDNGR